MHRSPTLDLADARAAGLIADVPADEVVAMPPPPRPDAIPGLLDLTTRVDGTVTVRARASGTAQVIRAPAPVLRRRLPRPRTRRPSGRRPVRARPGAPARRTSSSRAGPSDSEPPDDPLARLGRAVAVFAAGCLLAAAALLTVEAVR